MMAGDLEVQSSVECLVDGVEGATGLARATHDQVRLPFMPYPGRHIRLVAQREDDCAGRDDDLASGT